MQGSQKAVWVSSSSAAIFPAAAVDRLHIAADRALFLDGASPATSDKLSSPLYCGFDFCERVTLRPIARVLGCLD
jgi:hypothetical protein